MIVTCNKCHLLSKGFKSFTKRNCPKGNIHFIWKLLIGIARETEMYSYRRGMWQNQCSPQKLVCNVKFSDAPFSDVVSNLSLSRPRNLMTALSETKEVVKGLSFNVTTRGLVSTWTGGCLTLNSATFVSHTINRSILSVKVSGKPVEERVKHSDKEKDVFRLVTSVGQRKNSEFQWGIEHQIFGFRAPMLYHWATATAVSEVYYEVYMTRVQQTAKISNVGSVIFVK